MKRRFSILGFAALVVSCQQDTQSENPIEKALQPHSEEVIEQAEKLAYEACICQRKSLFSGTNDGGCWDRFKKETEDVFDEGYGTASYPITTNGSCSSATEQCIATDHELMLDEARVPLCTDQEVEVIDAVFEKIMDKGTAEGLDLNAADMVAQAAVRKLIDKLKQGKPITTSQISHARSPTVVP